MQCDYKESILKRELFTFILGNDTILKIKPFPPVAEESKQQKELLVDPIPPFQLPNEEYLNFLFSIQVLYFP